MSPRRRIRWSQLRIGLVVSVFVSGASVLIFFIDEFRNAIEDRYSLYFRTYTTQTLRVRAPVWLAGQSVGFVKSLAFEPPTVDDAQRLRVELSLRSRVRPYVTEGASAQIITSGLLGEAVVNILPATEPGPPLPEDTELPEARELDVYEVTDHLRALQDSVRPVAGAWQEVLRRAREGPGTISLVRAHPDELARLRGDLDDAANLFETLGTVGSNFAEVFSSPGVRAAMDSVPARMRRLAQHWKSGESSAGALSGDTIIGTRLESIAANLSSISERLESGRGTLGRFRRDQILAREIERTRRMVQALRAELAEARSRQLPSF